MNDRCTPATARRLKELGFYQPEAAFGQVWYDAEDNPFLVGNLDSPMWLADAYTYAPTASDILRELGEDWTMIVAGGGFQIYKHFQDPQYIFPIAANDNPAEACAEAWEAKQR